MAWLRHIGGRLENRYRYSIGLVYNTFPLPPASRTPTPRDWSGSRRPCSTLGRPTGARRWQICTTLN